MQQQPQSTFQLNYRQDETALRRQVIRILGAVLLGTTLLGLLADIVQWRQFFLQPARTVSGELAVRLMLPALVELAGAVGAALCLAGLYQARLMMLIYAIGSLVLTAYFISAQLLTQIHVNLPGQLNAQLLPSWYVYYYCAYTLSHCGLPILILLLYSRPAFRDPFASRD
jgi:hypothetical protein